MARKKLAKLPVVDPEAQKIFDEYWKPLVCYKNGKLKLDAVINELADYSRVTTEVSKVYMEITNGLMSKPNYMAWNVIALANDYNNEVWDETLKDEKEQWLKDHRAEIYTLRARVATLTARIAQLENKSPGDIASQWMQDVLNEIK